MLLKFALKNVFRNKKRSFLTALAIFFGSFTVILSAGWVNGILDANIRNGIEFHTGHFKIVHHEYAKRDRLLPVEDYIENSAELADQIRKIEGVTEVRERIRFGILLGHEDNSTFAVGTGISFENNKYKLEKKLIYGNISNSGVFIGKKLAEKLNLHLGDKILLATKTAHGGLNGIKLPIGGIFQYNINVMDDKQFFIRLENARKLLKLDNSALELTVFCKDMDSYQPSFERVKAILPKNLTATDFKEQLQGLYDFFLIIRGISWFIQSLILSLASFVVINTMMMAVFERTREIGTLKALGMTCNSIVLNFIIEGAIIGFIGGTLGTLSGYSLVSYFSHAGIPLGNYLKDVKIMFEYVIYPSASYRVLGFCLFMSIIIPALASIYPAWSTRKLSAADALKKS